MICGTQSGAPLCVLSGIDWTRWLFKELCKEKWFTLYIHANDFIWWHQARVHGFELYSAMLFFLCLAYYSCNPCDPWSRVIWFHFLSVHVRKWTLKPECHSWGRTYKLSDMTGIQRNHYIRAPASSRWILKGLSATLQSGRYTIQRYSDRQPNTQDTYQYVLLNVISGFANFFCDVP